MNMNRRAWLKLLAGAPLLNKIPLRSMPAPAFVSPVVINNFVYDWSRNQAIGEWSAFASESLLVGNKYLV